MSQTLSFWQLLGLLLGVLIGGRLLAGLIWRTTRRGVLPLTRGARSLASRQQLTGRLARRFPRAAAMASARVATDRFTGLPLLLMALLGAYLVFLGSDLVDDVVEGDAIVTFDHKINALLSVVREPHFLHVMASITHLANPMTLLAVTLVSAAFLWADGRGRYVPGLLISVLGAESVTYIGKYAIGRARPDFLTFASAITPSFPSGHATGAMALYGFVIYALTRDLHSARARFELAYWGAALILLIAASRIILSVHFFSDVAAGLLVGGFWLLAGFALTEYLQQRHQPG